MDTSSSSQHPSPRENERAPGSHLSEDGNGRRFVGIDLGAETIKLVELTADGRTLRLTRRQIAEHRKQPMAVLRRMLAGWDWAGVQAAAASGRFSRLLNLPRVPAKQAQAHACRHLLGDSPASVVSIGSHGFSVLELRANGMEIFRENNRCSQGTGNFLQQLVERFSLTVEEASLLAGKVENPALLSGRCPVILKSDMTHLANKGEDRGRILAGLFDAVCENVLVNLKPGVSPGRVVLIGGVSQAQRVRDTFCRRVQPLGMTLIPVAADDGRFFEALGCALTAARSPAARPALEELELPRAGNRLQKLPPLSAALSRVRKMPRPPPSELRPGTALILGFDIGSTGSKCVAIDAVSGETVWDAYRGTLGDPVGAAQWLLQQFVTGPAGACPLAALGVTGSGREIVGSLMMTCYGSEPVFILNEIAAHARGAQHYDPRVDTIFEIGGQDAKYIRLAGGRVIDCAMNEACSAGTGSFIEEQGQRMAGIRDVVHLGEEALAATEGVSLGQHCSVFMAEIIDDAVAAGVEQRAIIAGLYDSIVQNYLHRVKGNRSVGEVIFCQGKPFSADALAAAVARHTGGEVIIPPDPGTVGALGIALLARHEVAWRDRGGVDPGRFLTAKVAEKDNFICRATTGCGGIGNRCRIERLRTLVEARQQCFTWGGGCGLHDKGTRKRKLPDLAPDPFREREELIQKIVQELGAIPFEEAARPCAQAAVSPARPAVALSDEFMLKTLFPYFATFLHELGFELRVVRGGNQHTLRRGIQEANVPFCAPMQQFHGLASRMAEIGADYVFLPMVRSMPATDGERYAVTCPLMQACPDVLRWDLRAKFAGRILSPVIDVSGGNLLSPAFLDGCRELAAGLGCGSGPWRRACEVAAAAQARFDRACLETGRRALEYCAARGTVPVVVLGRPYTIHNTVLNSNVPANLREQGAMAIPVDCYPVVGDTPVFRDMYWSHGQRILRAAHQIRRTPGVYSLYCTNYSCGPDSFNLHFYAYAMEGKPFVIIETDGHSGDAGTKTRIEAFLHCIAQDRQAADNERAPSDFRNLERRHPSLEEIKRRGDILLIPWMGPASAALAACLRGAGARAEGLPMPDTEALQLGRRHTSGKECLPMCLTLGNLMKRLNGGGKNGDHFAVFMPATHGPCRLGCYNLLNQIALDRLGWGERIRIWSLADESYFDDLPGGFPALLFASIVASDLLAAALQDVRPIETHPGAAQLIYDRWFNRLLQLLEWAAGENPGLPATLWEVASGRLFGLHRLLADAVDEFAAIRRENRALPTVLIVGEIYVRCDNFANGRLIEELEARGLRTHLAPVNEWLEYTDLIRKRRHQADGMGAWLSSLVQRQINDQTYRAVARRLQWPARPTASEALTAAESYVSPELYGEAVLTIGHPVREWRHRHIDAAVGTGPLECMPNKIAEAQSFHIAEQEGLLSLFLPVNGDPLDPEVLDSFAFEVKERFARKNGNGNVRAADAKGK